jgi:hypothetical protein
MEKKPEQGMEIDGQEYNDLVQYWEEKGRETNNDSETGQRVEGELRTEDVGEPAAASTPARNKVMDTIQLSDGSSSMANESRDGERLSAEESRGSEQEEMIAAGWEELTCSVGRQGPRPWWGGWS